MNETTDVIGVVNCFAKMSVMSSIDFNSVALTFCKKMCHETWFFVVNFYYILSNFKFSGLIKVGTTYKTGLLSILSLSTYNNKMTIDDQT